jgi:hypothetical protein
MASEDPCYLTETSFLSEKLRVCRDEAVPLRRHVLLDEDRAHWTRGHAGIAVNTGYRVDVHLLVIGATLYAVNRAYIDASQIGCADAGLTNNVGQASCSAFESLFKVVSIHLCEMLPLLGEIVFGENRLDRASRFARATVNALVGVNV